jgi:outer membrane receptor protein involved in Fe transport
VEGIFVDDNTVDAAFYTDITVSYGFEVFGGENELYLSVNNVTNQEPPKDVGAPSSFSQPGNRNVYDFLGRYFNLGVRFKY